MKKLKHLFLFIAVLCVTCIMSAAVSAAETYTDVGAVEITLPALAAGRSTTIPLEYVEAALYSNAAKTKKLDSSLYEITSLILTNPDYPDTLAAGKEYGLTITIKAPSGKPKLRDPVNPDGLYNSGVMKNTTLNLNGCGYYLSSSLISSISNELIITAKISPSSSTKVIGYLRANGLSLPTYQGTPDYTMTFTEDVVELCTDFDNNTSFKNGIMWRYSDGVIVSPTGKFTMGKNPIVRLCIKAKDGYVLDFPENLGITLDLGTNAGTSSNKVLGIGKLTGYPLDKAVYIDVEVPMERTTVKVENGTLYSGNTALASGTKQMVGTTISMKPVIPSDYYFDSWTSSASWTSSGVTTISSNTGLDPNGASAKVAGDGNSTGTLTFTANVKPVAKKMNIYTGDTGKWTLYNATKKTDMPAYEDCAVEYRLSISEAQYNRGYRLEITGYRELYIWSGGTRDSGVITDFTSTDVDSPSIRDLKNGTVYLRDNSVSGDTLLTAKGIVYYQLKDPKGKVVWTDQQTFEMEFTRSEPLAAGMKFVLDDETYNLNPYIAHQGGASAYLIHNLDFYWTQPATVHVAGERAKLYVNIMVYINNVLVQNLQMTESTRKYDEASGQYYRITSAEIPACNPGDWVVIKANIKCDHAWVNGGIFDATINPEAGTYYTLTYNASSPGENAYIFNSYAIGDSAPTVLPMNTHTADAVAPAFVEFPVTITTPKYNLPEGSTQCAIARIVHNGNTSQSVTMNCTDSGVDSADGRTTSYVIDRYSFENNDMFSGVDGESFMIELVLTIRTSSGETIKIGTAALNISFKYDNRWKITSQKIDNVPNDDFYEELEIYTSYVNIMWIWDRPQGLADRFRAEPRLEVYREYDDECGKNPYTIYVDAELNTVAAGNENHTFESLSGDIHDNYYCKESTLYILIKDSVTGKTYVAAEKTSIYNFCTEFTRAVRIDGTDIGIGNSLPDQTVSPGTHTMEVDFYLPGLLVNADQYYIGVEYSVLDEDDNTIKSGRYLPESPKWNAVNTFELTLDIKNGEEYDIMCDLMLWDRTSQEWLWPMESNRVKILGSAGGGEGYTISGSLTTFDDDTEPVTIELIPFDSPEDAESYTFAGYATTYSIPNVSSGKYIMKVSKANHVTRTYSIEVNP
ncbi:MAG: hypothetical protein IJF78_11195 [Clostridia bacterium]|nr:hypothetical protein [Clostridia bacterium]